jgi:hypothetical protein
MGDGLNSYAVQKVMRTCSEDSRLMTMSVVVAKMRKRKEKMKD